MDCNKSVGLILNGMAGTMALSFNFEVNSNSPFFTGLLIEAKGCSRGGSIPEKSPQISLSIFIKLPNNKT